jgi:hypothetical protein
MTWSSGSALFHFFEVSAVRKSGLWHAENGGRQAAKSARPRGNGARQPVKE